MDLERASRLMSVRDSRGWSFHYTSCGIYWQGIVTVAKPLDDPTRRCTCGMEEAARVIADSPSIRRAVAAKPDEAR